MLTTENITIEEAYSVATKLHAQGRLEEAKGYYKHVIQHQPHNASLYNRLGAIFDMQDQAENAIALYEQATILDPNFAAAYYNLANILRDHSRFAEAIPNYRKVLQIQPDHNDALACLHHVLQHICAWDEYEKLTPRIEAIIDNALQHNARSPETPFVNITRCDNQAKNLAVANSWAQHIKQSMPSADLNFDMSNRSKSKQDVITIGYLSKNLQDRPTGHLARNLFKLHDRNKFRIIAYSYGADDGSEYRKKIKQDCDQFVDIQHTHYYQAAQKIYDDQVDILVDMQGYMSGNRTEISASKPAPIRISYLGYPGTAGDDIYDYIITDKICVPEDQAENFSEKLLYMPDCYQINDNKQPIANIQYQKSDFNIPDDSFVFCSFNWSHKLDRQMFAIWMNILKQTPNSIILLWKSSDLAETNLKQEATKHNVNTNRLIFSQKLPKDQHLARLKIVDLALDTRIYGGHTTTSDSLWAGTPVITKIGKHFSSRVCSSILTNAGLPELVTNSLDQYQNLAIKLANNPKQLNKIKNKLAKNKNTCKLFNTPKFVHNLEALYQNIWQEYRNR